MKIRPCLTNESTDSPLTNIKTNQISRNRTETGPTIKNEFVIPRSHEEYIHAQLEFENSTVSKKKTVRFDKDLNQIRIRTSSFSQSKNNHKKNFDIESPIVRTRLKSLVDKYENEETIIQTPIGDQSIFGKKWDKRWQGMFETYRKIQEISQKKAPTIKINFEKQFIQSDYITQENLNYLKHQLTKPIDLRDNFSLDKILQKHKFFKRFPKVVRMGLLREGIFREFDMNEMILSNTINNNYVYIILKGSCKIRAKAFTSYGQEIEFVSGSFYEGQHFGLSNLIQEQTVQTTMKMSNHELFKQSNYFSSSIYAQEQTITLEIQERVFKSVLMQTIEKEIKQKLGQLIYINRILKRVQMFQQIPQDQLIPLAAILQTQIYKFGDTIIKQGQLIDKLYIVSSGQVKSVIVTRNFREKVNCFTNQDISDINLISKIGRSTKSYQNANRIIKGNYIEYTNHQDIQFYQAGDIFGTTSLLHDDEISRTYKNNRYAQISIITVSSEAEVFIIDQGSFDTLSEVLQNHIKDHLRKKKEFDDINSKKLDQDQQQWDVVKQAFYKSYAQIKLKQKQR